MNLSELKQRTRSSETEDVNCKNCFENQEKILDIASDFYKYLEKN